MLTLFHSDFLQARDSGRYHLFCDKTLYVISLEGVVVWVVVIGLWWLYLLSVLIYDERVQMAVGRHLRQMFCHRSTTAKKETTAMTPS